VRKKGFIESFEKREKGKLKVSKSLKVPKESVIEGTEGTFLKILKGTEGLSFWIKFKLLTQGAAQLSFSLVGLFRLY